MNNISIKINLFDPKNVSTWPSNGSNTMFIKKNSEDEKTRLYQNVMFSSDAMDFIIQAMKNTSILRTEGDLLIEQFPFTLYIPEKNKVYTCPMFLQEFENYTVGFAQY